MSRAWRLELSALDACVLRATDARYERSPECGREFEFVRQKKNWGEDRVWFL